MAKLLKPYQLKALKNGTKVKSVTGEILTVGKNRLNVNDTRFGLTPYSVFKPKKKK